MTKARNVRPHRGSVAIMNDQPSTTGGTLKDDSAPDGWDEFGDDRNWDWNFGDEKSDQ